MSATASVVNWNPAAVASSSVMAVARCQPVVKEGSVRLWLRVCSRMSLLAWSTTIANWTGTSVPVFNFVEGGIPGARQHGLGDRVVVVVQAHHQGSAIGVGAQAPDAGMGGSPGCVDLVLLLGVPGHGQVGNPAALQAGPAGADPVVVVAQGTADQAHAANEGPGQPRRQGASGPTHFSTHRSPSFTHAGRAGARRLPPLHKRQQTFGTLEFRRGIRGPGDGPSGASGSDARAARRRATRRAFAAQWAAPTCGRGALTAVNVVVGTPILNARRSLPVADDRGASGGRAIAPWTAKGPENSGIP